MVHHSGLGAEPGRNEAGVNLYCGVGLTPVRK